MYTIGSIAEQAFNLLNPEGDDGRYDIQDFEVAAGQIRDKFLITEYYESIARGEREVTAEVIKTYEGVAVQYDTARQKSYVVLPAHFIRLPNNKGVFSIAPMQDEFHEYIPAQTGHATLLVHHAAFTTEGTPNFFVEGQRAIFTRKLEGVESVLVKLVPAASDIDINEELPMPTDLAEQIVGMLVNRMRLQAPQDKGNDNADAKP